MLIPTIMSTYRAAGATEDEAVDADHGRGGGHSGGTNPPGIPGLSMSEGTMMRCRLSGRIRESCRSGRRLPAPGVDCTLPLLMMSTDVGTTRRHKAASLATSVALANPLGLSRLRGMAPEGFAAPRDGLLGGWRRSRCGVQLLGANPQTFPSGGATFMHGGLQRRALEVDPYSYQQYSCYCVSLGYTSVVSGRLVFGQLLY